jgi:hypothetical protein
LLVGSMERGGEGHKSIEAFGPTAAMVGAFLGF